MAMLFLFYTCTAFHNNVQNYAITELRHKRVYGCRKKRLNIGTFF